MFAEFIEAHVNDKTTWIKEAFEEAAKSDDDDSGVEEEKQDTTTKVAGEENVKDDATKYKDKVANKQISDLEVSLFA